MTWHSNPRKGCCASWPKPCTYHEGWADGYEQGANEALDGAAWAPNHERVPG